MRAMNLVVGHQNEKGFESEANLGVADPGRQVFCKTGYPLTQRVR